MVDLTEIRSLVKAWYKDYWKVSQLDEFVFNVANSDTQKGAEITVLCKEFRRPKQALTEEQLFVLAKRFNKLFAILVDLMQFLEIPNDEIIEVSITSTEIRYCSRLKS